jgi:hypothetical protein
MKNQMNARPRSNAASHYYRHTDGVRAHAAKTFEHRHERRKIRGQLRRLDWALDVEDEVLA